MMRNNFFVVFLLMSMDNQQKRTRSDGSHGYPALLIGEGIITQPRLVDRVARKNSRLSLPWSH